MHAYMWPHMHEPTCVWMKEEKTCATGCQHEHTCISQEAIPIVPDDPRGRVIEAISTVITAFRDFPRRVHIGELRDPLGGYNEWIINSPPRPKSKQVLAKVHFRLVARVNTGSTVGLNTPHWGSGAEAAGAVPPPEEVS